MVFQGPENFDGEKKIADMLSSLKRADAPGDFNARVRARIARGETVSAHSWTASLIRVGAPIAVAIMIALGGYFVFTSMNTGQNDVPAVADVQSAEPQSQPELPESINGAQVPEASSSDIRVDKEIPDLSGEPPKRSGANGPSAAPESDRPEGSIDSAVGASKPILPRGFDPDATLPANAKGVDPNARINVASIFEIIGVRASWAGSGWRVDSVSPDNIAQRSGIKSGDVIEAINGQAVGEKTTFPARFDGKSVRVRRDDASVEINFKP